MLLLCRSELADVLSMNAVVDLIEDAFKMYQEGKSVTPLRSHVGVDDVDGVYLLMPSYLQEEGFFGTKVLSVYPQNRKEQKATINSVYILNDINDGSFLAIMDGSFLTGMRTSAASAVGAKYLARRTACIHGIIGTGVQALFQAEAMCAVRPIEKIVVYDLKEDAARSFAETVAQKLQIPVEALPTVKDVARQSDILTTTTTATTPVVSREDLREGCHINAVGAFTPTMREIDEKTLQEARVVVDTYEGCLKEAGDLIIPIDRGVYARGDIYGELGELVVGNKVGRQSEEEITLFKSVGIAFEDLVTATLAVKEAKEKNIGREIVLTN